MARVELSDVRKSYGTIEVIHGVSIDIRDGEFIVVVGPSGCGKSTLLRMVAGLEEVTSGSIAINGASVEKREPKDRDIAMVFQNYALYPHMTVYENMAYGLKMRGVTREEIAVQVKRAAQILEITQYLDRKPRNLSGGQRQRVAMGRAIVRSPSAFLFDEPLSNLDAKLRIQMRLEIKSLQRALGTTSIYVTHDQVEAMTLADRLVVLNKGKVEQIGPPMQLYEDPDTAFVAGFIGSPSMNFLSGVFSGGTIQVDLGDGSVARISVGDVSAAEGDAVILGLRPEHCVPANHDESGAIRLDVSASEPLGADTLIYGRVNPASGIVAVRLPGYVRDVIGQKLWFKAARSNVFLFDAASMKRKRSG